VTNPKDDFLAKKNIAVVGVSQKNKAFGNEAYRMLKQKGYKVYPVNVRGITVDGEQSFKSLDELKGKIEAVLTVVPPSETEKIVADCVRLGIKNVWMQQGSSSEKAIKICQDAGISEVHSACIFMYANPSSIHGVHGMVWKVIGKY